MSLDTVSMILAARLNEMREKGTSKGAEHIISGVTPATDGSGPRCYLEGYGNQEFLRMNSNSYLGLSLHPDLH